MLDCEGAMSPKAGLVREELLINTPKVQTGEMRGKLQGIRKKTTINYSLQCLAQILWPTISVL